MHHSLNCYYNLIFNGSQRYQLFYNQMIVFPGGFLSKRRKKPLVLFFFLQQLVSIINYILSTLIKWLSLSLDPIFICYLTLFYPTDTLLSSQDIKVLCRTSLLDYLCFLLSIMIFFISFLLVRVCLYCQFSMFKT